MGYLGFVCVWGGRLFYVYGYDSWPLVVQSCSSLELSTRTGTQERIQRIGLRPDVFALYLPGLPLNWRDDHVTPLVHVTVFAGCV